MQPPDPAPAPTNPTPKPARAKPGFIDRDLQDDITLATDLRRQAGKAEYAPTLAQRAWDAAEQSRLGASLDRCDRLIDRLRVARTGKGSRTKEEEAARKQLLTALDPILKGARRTFPEDSSERGAYGIGEDLANRSTVDLLRIAHFAFNQLISATGYAPPAAVLKGVLLNEIIVVGALHGRYRQADWAQEDGQQSAEELLAELRHEVEDVLDPKRRDLQGAADQAWTHRDPLHAARRKAFGLQPDRPLND